MTAVFLPYEVQRDYFLKRWKLYQWFDLVVHDVELDGWPDFYYTVLLRAYPTIESFVDLLAHSRGGDTSTSTAVATAMIYRFRLCSMA